MIERTDLEVRYETVMPSVTPVCFGTMYTGAQPEVHGIRRYEKPVIKIDTIFDVLIRNESSSVYEEGEVIRTDPVDGTELTHGQTIKLWISTGPDIEEKKMPNVVGMEIERAKELLEQLGFENVKITETDSDKPEGQVITQSVQKNTLLDVTSEIHLQVSRGPKETEPEVEEENSAPEATQESSFASFAFALPKRSDVCILSIYRVIGDERIEVIEAQEISPGTSSFFLDLTGTGTHIYEVYIDGELYKTQEVVFT